MKGLIAILFLFSHYLVCFSQNLVPNGDFETIEKSENPLVPKVACWTIGNYTPDFISYDYKIVKDPDVHKRIDKYGNKIEKYDYINFGPQKPHSGLTYVQMFFSVESEERIQVKLINKLIKNKYYKISLYASLTDYSEDNYVYEIPVFLLSNSFDYNRDFHTPLIKLKCKKIP